jgi:hypothetical protein
MRKTIEAAIANYERRLNEALERAADPENLPSYGVITGMRNDLTQLYMMRLDAEKKEALNSKLATIDAEQK